MLTSYAKWVMFLSSAVVISIPRSPSQIAFVAGGLNGLVSAADTAAVSKTGRVTVSTESTILLQVPLLEGLYLHIEFFIRGRVG